MYGRNYITDISLMTLNFPGLGFLEVSIFTDLTKLAGLGGELQKI